MSLSLLSAGGTGGAWLAFVSFEFTSPFFLLLLALVPAVWWLSGRSLSGLTGGRRATSIALRSLAVGLAVLALAGTRLLFENDRLCVIFVVDRSDSIPAERRQAILDHIEEVEKRRPLSNEDFVGVVVFGKDAGVEQSPRRTDLVLEDVATLIESEATNIQEAVQLAVAAFPEGVGGKRIVLFSDGNENVGNALEEVRSARSLGVTVDVVPVTYSHPAEIAVEKLIVSPEVNRGQAFSLQAVVRSTEATRVKLHIFENGNLMPQRDVVYDLEPGKNSFEFGGLRHDVSGRFTYEVQVEPVRAEDDTVPDNNNASSFTVIRGEPRVLLCTPEPDLERPLIETLEAESIVVDVREPEFLPRRMEDYIDYSAVLFSNVGAHQVSEEHQGLFENLVKGLGLGFLMIGGEDSFGAGGYQGTPIERLLPVDMEIKQKKVLPRGALAFVVHSCEIGNGNFWARKVIQQAIRILSPRDYAGVLYYDHRGGERWLFPMTPCSNKQSMFAMLQGFNPGDMPTFQPIMTLAHDGLKQVQAAMKHMIVLSDGDPSPPNAQLMQKIIRNERITISTICYGAHGAIPPGMRQMAQQGNGKFYHLTRPDQLPEIFIREATKVRKSLISEEPFTPLLHAWGEMLRGLGEEGFPPLDGYVLTTPKSLATLHLVHPGTDEDPTQDPVLATWTYGLGKTAAFTSDAGRRWGKAWTGWAGYRRFWSQLVRWIGKPSQSNLFRVSRQLEGGRARLVIEAIDEAGSFLNGLRFEGSVVTPGPRHETREIEPRQVRPGQYVVEIDADTEGTYALNLRTEIDGSTVSYTTGISVPYSPEYRQLETDQELLRRLADAGGGRYVESEVDYFSRDFEALSTVQDVWRSLLIAAICLFFADVFVRRVMVDPRAVWARATAAASVLLDRSRRAEKKEADERLSSLLQAKAKVRQRTERRAGVGAAREAAEEEPEGTGFDAAFDAGESVSAAREKVEARVEERRDASADEKTEEGASYTSRLLQAKRRALRKDEEE